MNIKGKVLASVLALGVATTGGFIMGSNQAEEPAHAYPFNETATAKWDVFKDKLTAYDNWDILNEGSISFTAVTYLENETNEKNKKYEKYPSMKVYSFRNVDYNSDGSVWMSEQRNFKISSVNQVMGKDFKPVDGQNYILVMNVKHGASGGIMKLIPITQEEYDKGINPEQPTQPPACK